MKNPKNNGEDNTDNFLLNLYKDVSVERRWQSDELSDLKCATKKMVNRIRDKFKSHSMKENESKGLTDVIVSEAGSMADGTKIIDPDEFDFTMAFIYSQNTIKALPSSNESTYLFSKAQVNPKDARFKEIYRNNENILPIEFVKDNFHHLKSAIEEARSDGPVEHRGKTLYLRDFDEKDTYYGMQGPSFNLHNLLKWHSPNRQKDLIISVDLVPAIHLNDKRIAENVPLFKQEYPCGENILSRPDHCLLMPMKCRHFFTTKVFHDIREGNEKYRKDKLDFINSHFMVSFSGYETALLKQWQWEKSVYHNWYICYTIMKCFGTLNHGSSTTVNFIDNKVQLTWHTKISIPERNESFSSYSWKSMVFTKAKEDCGQILSLSQCFNRLTSQFEEEKLKNLKVIEIKSSLWPSEIAEIVDISEKDLKKHTQFVERMKSVKIMMNNIKADQNYNYEKYKKRLVEIFPQLSPHFKYSLSSKL